METSYHFIHQNTKNIGWFSIFREVLIRTQVAAVSAIPSPVRVQSVILGR